MKTVVPRLFRRSIYLAAIGILVVVLTGCTGRGGGQLPDGVQMALVGWRRLQTCASLDLAVAFDFTSQYSYPTTQDREYVGEAPERGAAM